MDESYMGLTVFKVDDADTLRDLAKKYLRVARLPLPDKRTITRPGSKWISWNKDLASAYAHWKRGDLTIREWLSSPKGR